MKDLPKAILDKVNTWLCYPYDLKTQKELELLLDQDKQKVYDAFYTHLNFGTAGLRGLMGVGTNRINEYTIGLATQGLASYILQSNTDQDKSVVIAFDSRMNSQNYAEEAARILAGNQIKVFLSKELRPTPFLSFMCRQKKATAAIMITASHNPPEYNGYKVYWSDGAQIVSPHDVAIISEVKKVTDISMIKKEALSSPLIQYLTEEDDQNYITTLSSLQNRKELCHQEGSSLQILYSNMHGTGITLLPNLLSSWGFKELYFVEEQKKPSGYFPGAKNPNPESKETMALGVALLLEKNYDLFLATDPDADRVGIGVNHNGKGVLLSGNEIGVLCTYYLVETFKKSQRLSKNHVVISTIVTTRLIKKICQAYDVQYIDVLTGFKYIGEKIREFETEGFSLEFLFGAEESYGYLYGTHARDKDALITCALVCEMALFYKKEKKTLIDVLHEIYHRFGLFQEKQLSIQLKENQTSLELIANIMEKLRKNPPSKFGANQIIKIEDYKLGQLYDTQKKTTEPLMQIKSDVLTYHLDDGSSFVIRPSGTEPKIKIYSMMHQGIIDSLEKTISECQKNLDEKLFFIKKELLSL